MKTEVLVYGAYGYTGTLITDELLKHGIRPIVAGRNRQKIEAFARDRGIPHFHADLHDNETFARHLPEVNVVIHCAGPFIHTAKPMVRYCIEHNCHYLDITGEYQVFEMLQEFGEQARHAGIMLLPGAGFDVVPSDCLAGKLKAAVPDATSLTLAFTTKGGGISRGTAKTMVEGVSDGLTVRRDGQLIKLPLGSEIMEIDYGPFRQISSAIPWGDISSAYFSTGIPNITVYSGTSEKQIRQVQMVRRFSFMFRFKFFRNYLHRNIDKRPPGPDEKRRKNARTYLYGKAEGEHNSAEIRLTTPEGYSLTARTVCRMTECILEGQHPAGFQTPSTAYGYDFITTIEGVDNWH